MGASAIDGPFFRYGNMSALLASMTGGPVLPDPNSDAGPDGVFQGVGFLDIRYWYQKDKVTGFQGTVPAHFMMPTVRSVSTIPFALSSSNIAAAQNAVSGTAMTLAGSSSGIVTNIPIWPFNPGNINGPGANQAAAIASIALDFGFGFGTTTAGSGTLTANPPTMIMPGMPLIIAGAGNSAGTMPLLTNVLSVNPAANQITVGPNIPLASLTGTPIGTGNLWSSGSEQLYLPGTQVPTAALPYIAGGPGLFFDNRQGLTRGLQITGSSGAAGGTFLISGWDVYGHPMSQLLTVAAGASTGWTTKCFKYIGSVVPQFSDAHNYSVGTSDLFGLNYRVPDWEDTTVCWNALTMTSATGFTKSIGLGSTSTSITGDIRGTIQVSASGPGSGIGSTVSNGSITGNALTGNRLSMASVVTAHSAILGTTLNPATIYGIPQA